MTAAVLEASRRELALYQQLWAVYGRLEALLAASATDVDPTAVSAGRAEAAALTTALAELGAHLAPHRLRGDAVGDDVAACWRESATLAAAAYEANQRLLTAARRHRTDAAARLGALGAARRASAGYRAAAAR